jgi:hypothetical protein
MSRVVLSPSETSVPLMQLDKGRPTLVYWSIRGLAQACRLALEFSGEPYDDVRIDAGAD